MGKHYEHYKTFYEKISLKECIRRIKSQHIKYYVDEVTKGLVTKYEVFTNVPVWDGGKSEYDKHNFPSTEL